MLVAARRALLGNILPTWAWDFRRGVLPPGATFTRASAGGYWNASGVRASATTNVPRFDYDPVTLQPLGYLSEVQSTNSVLRSDAFDHAFWSKQKLTVTADQIVAPDGATAADMLTEDNTTGGHQVFFQATLAADTYAGFSVFVKAGTRSKFFLAYGASVANHYATVVFDAATGTISQTSVGSSSGTIASTYVRAVGNGRYRFGMVAKVAGANAFVLIGLASAATGNTINSSGEVSYAGDGASFGYAWGAQQDSPGVGVTSYIPTAGSTVTRAADVLSLPLSSMPGWQASQGGVLVATWRLHTPNAAGANQIVARIDDAGNNNVVSLIGNQAGSNTRRSFVVSGGNTQGDVGAGIASGTLFVRTRTALGWGTSRVFIAADGVAGDGDSGALALPVSPTQLLIGSSGASQQLNGTIESIGYYAGQRPDGFVQGVSRG